MLFSAEVTVLTTNTVDNPEEVILKIAHGILTSVEIQYPPGCHRQVHCIILHHEHQIAPSTENMSLAGDTTPIKWGEYYECYQPPYELKIKAWAVSCDYNHVIDVRVAILPRKAIIALAVVDAIKSVLGMLSPRRIFTGGG